jgi:hypothetical protein
MRQQQPERLFLWVCVLVVALSPYAIAWAIAVRNGP